MNILKNDFFEIKENENGKMVSLNIVGSDGKMNWIEGEKLWGTVLAPEGIGISVKRFFNDNGNLTECYCLRNETDFPIVFNKKNFGIYTPFNDNYEDTDVCLSEKCHTHIFCGKEAAWIAAMQMGGRGKNVGLKIKKGSLEAYSIERKLLEESNDRGDFILHFKLPVLEPGESTEISWELFLFENREEFEKQLLKTPHFPVVKSDKFVYFEEENIHFEILVSGMGEAETPEILCDCQKIDFKTSHVGEFMKISCDYKAKTSGTLKFKIKTGDRQTKAVFLVKPKLMTLVQRRCRFIAKKQQYHRKGSHLDGAYLIYDNEEKSVYYSHRDDHNGGRERLCMGIVNALYLQRCKDLTVLESLKKYISYFYRELYDRKSGTVFNDIRRNNDWHRLYNYPWAAVFQIELYHLFKEKEYLKDAFSTMHRYYSEDGKNFYGIAIPAVELFSCLKNEQMEQEAEIFCREFIEHAEIILKNGLNFPPFEVRYEQSIVAPAVSCLIQAYMITKDYRYKDEAAKQLHVLSLFNGWQPDYHQYQVAVRHWDGKWFGKYECYGDTYPHYWSSLTGMDFAQYAHVFGGKEYERRADASLRASLSLIGNDGTASCAMVYPEYVNGHKAHYYDPWANDQDWALYFAMKYEKIIS